MMKVNNRDLIMVDLFVILLFNIITDLIDGLSFIGFIPDLFNIYFFVVILLKYKINKEDKRTIGLIVSILILLLFDFLNFLIRGENFFLFIWGVRNQYRYLFFCFFCAVILKKEDILRIYEFFYKITIVNFVVITIEFLMGYERDFLGGTFGVNYNCNGISNVFITIMLVFTLVMWLKKEIDIKRMFVVFFISLYWAILAELKVVLVEVTIMVAIVVLTSKMAFSKKIIILVSSLVALPIARELLIMVFPAQAGTLSLSGMIDYLKYVNLGIHGFGRLTAIPRTNEYLFNNETIFKLVGIGVGNAEFLSFGDFFLSSEFYQKFVDFAYQSYFYAFIYVERGFLGLIWYFLFFFRSFKTSRMLQSFNKETALIKDAFILIFVFVIIFSVYDSSLRISTSGYIVFMVLSFPYVLMKDELKVDEFDRGKIL